MKGAETWGEGGGEGLRPGDGKQRQSAVLFEKFKPAAAALTDSIDWNTNINIWFECNTYWGKETFPTFS